MTTRTGLSFDFNFSTRMMACLSHPKVQGAVHSNEQYRSPAGLSGTESIQCSLECRKTCTTRVHRLKEARFSCRLDSFLHVGNASRFVYQQQLLLRYSGIQRQPPG